MWLDELRATQVANRYQCRSEGYDMTMLDSPSPHLPAVRFPTRFSASPPACFFST
ncbi:hypothetical protein [Burkholderia catarinensis]|uniref:hypothetical protein n=1 Tax=Burkholderia catarinensis TaxID=1108140 RepID=UPI0013017927|nr:hypothetical protein [Burkholderia catarinensis]